MLGIVQRNKNMAKETERPHFSLQKGHDNVKTLAVFSQGRNQMNESRLNDSKE